MNDEGAGDEYERAGGAAAGSTGPISATRAIASSLAYYTVIFTLGYLRCFYPARLARGLGT